MPHLGQISVTPGPDLYQISARPGGVTWPYENLLGSHIFWLLQTSCLTSSTYCTSICELIQGRNAGICGTPHSCPRHSLRAGLSYRRHGAPLSFLHTHSILSSLCFDCCIIKKLHGNSPQQLLLHRHYFTFSNPINSNGVKSTTSGGWGIMLVLEWGFYLAQVENYSRFRRFMEIGRASCRERV